MIHPTRSADTARARGACDIHVIFFDFGGVLAEEGFRNGLRSIARNNGLDPEEFTGAAVELVFSGGYVVGRATEKDYWNALREAWGLSGGDGEWRSVILNHFVVRPGMIDVVRRLNKAKARLAILSDQTNWLDELDRRHDFFRHFEQVFNSYHLGKSKRDPTLFDDVLAAMAVQPQEALFVDDTPGNVSRARERGLNAILFQEEDRFRKELLRYCPGI